MLEYVWNLKKTFDNPILKFGLILGVRTYIA